MIDLREDQMKVVRRVLADHVPECEVRAFGSRVAWTASDSSDLDLVLVGKKKLDWRNVAKIKRAFEESDLPFRVDVLDWHAIPESFRKNILKKYEVIQFGDASPVRGGAAEESSLYRPLFPPEWDRHQLYDLADWINGLAFRSVHFSPTGKPVVKIAEIKNGLSGQTKYTQADYDEKYRLVPGDMLFSWSGQPETSIDAFWWRGPEGWLNQHIFKVLPKDTCDRTFFYYLLKYLKPHFIRIAHNKQTTGLGHVTKSDLQRMEVAVPKTKEEQKAIAHILGTLDGKIELNRRMNETLEGIARAIFKSWFIDFDPVIDNALRAGNPIPDSMAERAAVRRRLLDQNQPSPGLRPPSPSGRGAGGEGAKHEVEGRKHYRGGYDFAGLVETARELRKKQTPAEDLFWELVRNRRFLNLKFRRQHQLGDYIADFYCHEHRLVIELDGGIHDAKQKKDHKRDAWMQAQGYTVLRFKNEQLLNDPESILNQIASAILPLPLGEGRGEGSSPSGRGLGEGMVESTAFDHLFPDEFEDSELGEIPTGWRVKPITEAADVIGGGTPKTRIAEYWGGTIPWFSVADTPLRSDIFVVTTEKSVTQAGIDNSSAKVLAPGIVIVTARGTVGNLALTGVPMAMNQSCYALRDTSSSKGYFLYFSLLGLISTLKTRTHGSVFDTITRNTLATLSMVVPPDHVREAFESVLTPLMGHILLHLGETMSLQTCRDSLLPALLSGNIALPGLLQNAGRAS